MRDASQKTDGALVGSELNLWQLRQPQRQVRHLSRLCRYVYRLLLFQLPEPRSLLLLSHFEAFSCIQPGRMIAFWRQVYVLNGSIADLVDQNLLLKPMRLRTYGMKNRSTRRPFWRIHIGAASGKRGRFAADSRRSISSQALTKTAFIEISLLCLATDFSV